MENGKQFIGRILFESYACLENFQIKITRTVTSNQGGETIMMIAFFTKVLLIKTLLERNEWRIAKIRERSEESLFFGSALRLVRCRGSSMRLGPGR